MDKVILKLIENVPKWFLLTVLALLIGWFGGLSYVAFFTNRNVEFWPPKVGTDKQLLAEIQLLSQEARQLQAKHDTHLVYLRSQLANVRERAASEKSFSLSRPEGYEEASRSYEKEINEYERRYSADLKILISKVNSLENKIK